MKILCNLNLFSLNQIIYLVDNNEKVKEIATVSMTQIPKAINELCNEYSVNKVIMSGYGVYAKEISKDITEYNLSHYNNHNIEIEVI